MNHERPLYLRLYFDPVYRVVICTRCQYAVLPTAMAATPSAPQGQELFRMFEAEKQSAAMAELPTLF